MVCNINGETKLYAVIGDPIGHSLSPQIHNGIFQVTGKNGVYIPLRIAAENLREGIPLLKSSFAGFNVTIPHKERIIPFLDGLDDRARWYGAVNTVKIQDGKMVGYNTDGYGWIRSLETEGISIEGKKILLLGAGGAARAAAYEILLRGGQLTIANRTLDRAQQLRKDLAENTGRTDISISRLDEIEKGYFAVINATSVGMHPRENEMPIQEHVLEGTQVVYDMVYNPYETKLLNRGKALGCQTLSGLSMLFYQAVRAQEIWAGETLQEEKIKGIYEDIKKYISTKNQKE